MIMMERERDVCQNCEKKKKIKKAKSGWLSVITETIVSLKPQPGVMCSCLSNLILWHHAALNL
jgi:hypothetical protein